jgi:phosphoribosyl 1,2-cyclic phosphodiesterase
MSLFITALASGSNGNCYYIGNQQEAVLVDAGISCREIETRMQRLGLSPQTVKAVFISHEHSDHIQGLPALARRWRVPVYITAATQRFGRLHLSEQGTYTFRCSEPVLIGNLSITPFSKAHDAADPHSFVVACQGVKVGVFTDIGAPCTRLIRHFSECHAAFLEANYDEQMLLQGSYPAHLKARIRGGRGHLSNRQALELFKAYRPAYMSHLLLAHLSKNNNCPRLVHSLFQEQAGSTTVVVASRYQETALYSIANLGSTTVTPHYSVAASQLTFSF